MSLDELQAYVTLRGSLLSQEDKKKIILESDSNGSGVLTMERVSQAVRTLGTGFFQEMIGGPKKQKGKVYEAMTFATETGSATETETMPDGAHACAVEDGWIPNLKMNHGRARFPNGRFHHKESNVTKNLLKSFLILFEA